MREKIIEKGLMPFVDLFNNTTIIKKLNYWRVISQLSEDELNDLASDNLVRILKYARSTIPFYSNVQIENSLKPEELIPAFPIIYKEDIKSNMDNLLSEKKSRLLKYASSGSSGIQGTVYMNKTDQSIIRAIMLLWWEWAGYKFGKPTFQTGMSTDRGFVKSLKDFFLRIHYAQAFNLDGDIIFHELKTLRVKRNMFLAGYASSLNVYADVCLKRGIDVKFDAAICWGDKLFDQYKKNIKNAFGCDVNETYSCNEGFLVGAKKDLDYFYIMSPHVYVEIVDKNGNPVPDGQLGYVLLTRLDGFSMPLIRYYVGDLAIKLPREKYPEKREMYFPLLEKVIGRDTDIVVTSSGKRLIVHFFTGIFEFVPEIQQFIVIQREVSGIEIDYIPNPDFTPAVLERLEKIFYDKLKEKLNVTWRAVDNIPPTASGKPQLIQSYIGKV